MRYCATSARKLLADPFASRDACGVGFIASRQAGRSHDIIQKSVEALQNLAHRGAIGADGKTGDGAGILTEIPHRYYQKKAAEQGASLPSSDFAAAMIFYPADRTHEIVCRRLFHKVLKKYDVPVLWSREVPVNQGILGSKAASVRPRIWQKFLGRPRIMTADEFEQFLFLIRKEVVTLAEEYSYEDFYVPSLSSRTIVHKGLFMGRDLAEFYADLKDPEFVSSFAVFHQRFSTNTFPSWRLAQPFRMLAHNGEINTIRGNRNWMQARERADQPRLWVPAEHALKRFMMSGLSDSASFDNALEAYVFGGRSIVHSIVHMMPEAWQNKTDLDPDLEAFYNYHACIAEHWGGPAAIAFSDGRYVGAALDRNGLRPARYKITRDYLLVCSEAGCVELPAESVEESGKLSPGTMIVMELGTRQILKNHQVKKMLTANKPYKRWVEEHVVMIQDLVQKNKKKLQDAADVFSDDQAFVYTRAFGWTRDDLAVILHPMFATGEEPVGSMGDDTPLSVFSQKPRLLYTYFKQLFAQVTNPPIDPIREKYVTSLRMYLGKSGNIFEETPLHARQIRVDSPIVTHDVFHAITHHPHFRCATLLARFKAVEGAHSLADTVLDFCLAAEKAVDDGAVLLVLSDRHVSRDDAPIPMLLAVSAVHHYLSRAGKRLNISLLVETGEAREVHHHACLIGYGASVIYPYLALHEAQKFGSDAANDLTPAAAQENYIQACEKGLLKIMSKMGISVLQAYHAAQIFEAVGLNDSVVRQHFTGTPSKISGSDLNDIARDYLVWHRQAFDPGGSNVLDMGGFYRSFPRGEYHAFNPQLVRHLHKAVIGDDFEEYRKYRALVNEREPMTIRDLLKIKTGDVIPIEAVESKENIVKRFCTPGISYGAVSKETHETMAVAMNRLGAKSDSGEGGEDHARFRPLPNGDSTNSAIKQVASARFGVTAYYLSQARELEIKIAQGAKPGEGGQLPGHKVSAEIASVRHATPGVALISPAPHHDIYSIEDLAQLIYDLKQANPNARVCVKLVAEDGVGTIAAGVVKAHADVILISGHDGGTGASPLGSIKHAGLPWELGLSEVQQVLVANHLRGRVTLRVDGGLKTGLDVMKAALLGAEEFGFGTSSLIALGCVMARQCHLNTCPVGVATQDPALRSKYQGTPERLIRMFYFIAEEIRGCLAQMGFKSLDEIVGRVELLEQIRTWKGKKIRKISLERVLRRPATSESALRCRQARNDWIGDTPFDDELIRAGKSVLETGTGNCVIEKNVRNVHRSIGARLSFEIVRRYGPEGLPQGCIRAFLRGSAGQSLGAFAAKSVELHLEGEANDYVGKGLSGAVVSLKPFREVRYDPKENIICGNTCLYGATGGSLFVNGRAGERFAVRNSGAFAVVEGVGDHGCEYMTGGHVLILGSVGYNFAAGMTGGMATVYDSQGTFKRYCNLSDVKLFPVDWSDEPGRLCVRLLQEHVRYTNSPLAKTLLGEWEKVRQRFVRVIPKEILKLQTEKRVRSITLS